MHVIPVLGIEVASVRPSSNNDFFCEYINLAKTKYYILDNGVPPNLSNLFLNALYLDCVLTTHTRLY